MATKKKAVKKTVKKAVKKTAKKAVKKTTKKVASKKRKQFLPLFNTKRKTKFPEKGILFFYRILMKKRFYFPTFRCLPVVPKASSGQQQNDQQVKSLAQ